jgi:hypothetical protein
LKRRLAIGQILLIPFKNGNKVAVGTAVNQNQIFHEVLPKETKYSIAKQYGITIEELEKRIQRWWLIYLLAINY